MALSIVLRLKNIVRFGLCLMILTAGQTATAGSLVTLANKDEFSAQQHWSPFACLSTVIYFEARSESTKGQTAVGHVVLNRVDGKGHPNTVCGVVYENSHKKNRCQFSFACDGKKEVIKERAAFLKAQRIARTLLSCNSSCRKTRNKPGSIASSTHFHTSDVSPSWSRKFLITGSIGRHIFYSASRS